MAPNWMGVSKGAEDIAKAVAAEGLCSVAG